jgi:glycosyltransferase involved in cell wall biosynthesis
MSRKISIIQLFDAYPVFYQPYIPPVVDALRAQSEIDLQVVAIRKGDEKSPIVEVLPWVIKRKLIAKLLQRLVKRYHRLDYVAIKALREKTDIIHLQHSYLHSEVVQLLQRPRESRPKVIITLRGADTYVRPWERDSWKDFYRDHGNQVDAFITMSEHQRQYLHTKWGVEKERIHVIPISFGASFQVLPKTPAPDTLNLVSVFRMCWEKNIAGNLQFVKAIKDRNIPVRYSIYGDGPDLGQVYYLRDQYGLTEEVQVFGKVPNASLKEKLRSYDFILQLSHSEAFPTSVLEAQSFGLPAIVSNNGGLPEMIQDHWNGVVVPLDKMMAGVQEVILIWKDAAVYKTMSENAIAQTHQKYTIVKEVEQLMALYKSVL